MDPAQASFDVICGSSSAAAATVCFDGIAVKGRYGLGDVFDCADIGLKNERQGQRTKF